ncbi:MAG: thioester reductase domain-containing protein [SAR202 cluster bacterium]|jgi:amino acid adenylation domain-containing protein/thioester reductase-like protein|nr:thioester reductase domain-containing protein [SAR202 cluster bacterium]MDP6513937.1 thioester reductase domain-containing protein [SAR202 cluster bacterium]MDP6713542.1 thioester reductase domain-containing protein [SAR202 cluster bacterium]
MNQPPLHQLFQLQAKKTPDAVAVVDGARSITYEELDDLTDSLAGYLQQQGITHDDPVGIFMDTCAEYVIAYIAILKAGGAYMPLDLAYPDSFLGRIFAEAKPKVAITKNQYAPRLSPEFGAIALSIDTDNAWRDFSYDEDAGSSITLDNLAFLAYTSGTTGEPKGVLQTHQSSVHSYLGRYEISSYKPGDRVACNIFFVWELLRPLLKGGATYVIPDDVIYDPRLLTNFIADNEITEILFTPSLLETTLNSISPDQFRERLSSLNTIWLNGEVVTARLKNRVLDILPDHVRLLNTYSISESHDVSDVDLRVAEELPSKICSVGRPRTDVVLRLLDEDMKPSLPGEAGELYIGGPDLAKGYLNKPDITAERFVLIDGARYYRTGDLAEIHPDGQIEIKGRCDFMVKIRGYSINLGAVETALLEHPDVKSCAVIADGEEGEEKRLVSYIVRSADNGRTNGNSTRADADIRDSLKDRLPQHMIPSIYIELDEIPINQVTGKLDRKSLPAPAEQHQRVSEAIILSEEASLEEQEAAMGALWERILYLDEGTITGGSDFFDYGGHSLLAVELTLAIEEVFGVELFVKEIYEFPTVSSLVQYIAQGTAQTTETGSIREDAVLDPSIIPATTVKPLSIDSADSIFLTGATGFLGGFLLHELLRSTGDHVKIYTLARTKTGSSEEALNRIVQNLESYGLRDQDMEKRIVPVVGDLTERNFGLSPDHFGELADKIDAIFHCAALVNYVYSYPVVKPSIVDGTREVLRFACESVTKPLYHVSTNGVFPRQNDSPILESDDIGPFADRLEDGYSQAKWVAETLVWEAASRGLPVSIYRPGNIGHHSVTGKGNPNDFQSMIIDACINVNCVPTNVNWMFEITPIDFLVNAITRFASSPSHLGQAYNVVQNDPTPAETVFNLLVDTGNVSEQVSVDEWKSRLYAKAKTDDDPLLIVLAQSLDDIGSYLVHESAYDCSHFEKALSTYEIEKPLVNADYFETALMDKQAQSSIISAMSD